MDNIDKLLAELQAEYTEKKTEVKQPPIPPAKPLISSTPPSVAIPQQLNLNSVKSSISSASKSDSLLDDLLDVVKSDFAALDAAEELRKQQEIEQEKIRQAKLRKQQLKALEKQAKDWLAKLDPLSPEGLWFERFAESYPSKLEAAIEYMQTNI
ncbi:MAG TPA: hypothetical protein VK203_06455 [Nostocaceae cyanobacterium]|nr:hypothetical protein [Nostocaceae cyanobacterium]